MELNKPLNIALLLETRLAACKELHKLRIRFDGKLVEPFDLVEVEKPKWVWRAKKNTSEDDQSSNPPTSKLGYKQRSHEDSPSHTAKAEAPKPEVPQMEAPSGSPTVQDQPIVQDPPKMTDKGRVKQLMILNHGKLNLAN
ncbi:hypothetical protein R1flu_011339 [Riccia fluitans]|uniref:Uncharacterized protein n=1 Tax=Riccia fluitans TaxID=41844 RepID=A0ABD1Z7I5_9MARC